MMKNKVKVLLKREWKTNVGALKTGNKTSAGRVLTLLFAYGVIYAFLLLLALGMFDVFEMSNTIPVYLLFGFIIIKMVTILYTITAALGTFYFSDDLESLMVLPVRPWEIFLSKYLTIFIADAIMSLAILAPMIIRAGIAMGEGVWYYIYMLINAFFVPALPGAIVILLVLVMMRYTNVKKNRNLVRYIGYAFLLLLMMGYYYFIGKTQDLTEQDRILIMTGAKSLVDVLGNLFITAKWAVKGGLGSGFLQSLGYLALNALTWLGGFLLLWKGSSVLYIDSLVGLTESSGGKREKKDKAKKKEKSNYASSSARWAIMKKEVRLILREPYFVFQYFGGPFVLVAMIFFLSSNESSEELERLMRMALNEPVFFWIAGLIGLMLGCFSSGFVNPAMNSLTREGSSVWISQVLPIRAEDQVLGRVVPSLVVGIFFNLIYSASLC